MPARTRSTVSRASQGRDRRSSPRRRSLYDSARRCRRQRRNWQLCGAGSDFITDPCITGGKFSIVVTNSLISPDPVIEPFDGNSVHCQRCTTVFLTVAQHLARHILKRNCHVGDSHAIRAGKQARRPAERFSHDTLKSFATADQGGVVHVTSCLQSDNADSRSTATYRTSRRSCFRKTLRRYRLWNRQLGARVERPWPARIRIGR